MAADLKQSADQLRKLANAIRARVASDEDEKLKTAAHTLRAAKGLTLLREKVRR
jgi:hypothetical protein